MPEPLTSALAFSFFDRLLQVIGLVRDDAKAKKAEKQAALSAVGEALHATECYIRERRSGLEPNSDQEMELSEKWRRASLSMSIIDSSFGAACWEKGGYWMDPDAWSAEKVEANGIALTHIDQKMRILMGIAPAP